MNTRLSNEINTVCWQGDSDGHLEILDQTKLPTQIKIIICKDVPAVVESIKLLRVRGAPAIGIAGAYGMVLAVHQAVLLDDSSNKKIAYIQQRAEELATSRPTAVNLRWAIQRIERLIVNAGEHPDFSKLSKDVLAEAKRIQEEDQHLCEKIGDYGASILPDGDLLTHCNTGALATGGIGTALGVIVTAWEQGRRFHVFADETRPLLQGTGLQPGNLPNEKYQ